MEVVTKKKHSELGIASFSIAIFELIIWSVELFIEKFDYSSILSRFSRDLYLYTYLGLPIVSLMLGIWGLSQKNRVNTLAVAGMVISIFELIVSGLALFLYGLLAIN